MSPTSNDPVKRQRQLANLNRGGPAPEPGNQRARKHGAYATVVQARLDEKIREVFDAIAEDAPLRADDGGLPAADAVVVRLLAAALCRVADVEGYLADFGWRDVDTGEPRTGILDLEARLRREARDHADALGMTPRSRAALGLDVAHGLDLARQWAQDG